jgi:hypothetical protein
MKPHVFRASPFARGAMLLAVTLGSLALSARAEAGIASVEGPIPVTPTSVIYGAAAAPNAGLSVDLARHGYVEEEYFIGGTANVYRHEGPSTVSVLEKDLPYVTRIIVRRPRDAAKFSGIVHLEPLHPAQGGNSHWLANASYMMASGDIYVAAALGDDARTRRVSAVGPAPTSQSEVVKWFDPVRYAALRWPDEDGIAYDVLGDIGTLLRSARAENPFKATPIKAILVGGWSFTGSLQRIFINEGFHDRFRLPGGKPVFDGYLIGISSRWNAGGYGPLNKAEPPVANDDPRRSLAPIDAPVIEFLSEFEVATGPRPQLPDSDAAKGAHRVYQLGGVIHSSSLADPALPRSARPNLTQLVSRGYPLETMAGEEGTVACSLPISDVPHAAFARAALDNLKQWVVDGRLPPHGTPLALDAAGKVVRDAAGNPQGGVRAAEFTVPLAGFGPYNGDDRPECLTAGNRPLFVRNALSAAELKRRYGTVAAYLRRYDAAVDALVRQRWLLPADAAHLKLKTRGQAQAQFTGR